MIENDVSSDGETTTSSDESSDSDSSGVARERASILGASLELPREFCEDPAIFRSVMSIDTWKELSETERRHLRRFLPHFEADDAREKEITVRKLFAGETFNLNSPLLEFQKRLREGHYRPDAQRLRRALGRSRRKLARHRQRRRSRRSLKRLLASRERLLLRTETGETQRQGTFNPSDSTLQRVHRRYRQEFLHIHTQVYGDSVPISEDEDFRETPAPVPERYYRLLKKHQDDDNAVASTFGLGKFLARDIRTLDENWKRRALITHRKRRSQFSNCPDLNTDGITLDSILYRMGDRLLKNSSYPNESVGIVQKSQYLTQPKITQPEAPISPIVSEVNLNEETKCEPSISNSEVVPNEKVQSSLLAPSSPKVEDVKIEDIAMDEEVGLQLVQATHACFLSVIRDLMCSTPRHCLPLHSLESLIRNWRQNPIAPLNHWYSSVEDWVKALPSVISFLAGESSSQPEDFVPFLLYKPSTHMYQWIGAGRDSDSSLTHVCSQWLSQRTAATSPDPVTPPVPVVPVPPPPKMPSPEPQHQSQPQVETIEKLGPLTNPKWNSKWQVSNEELEAFRSQEVVRFQQPHRAFTYRLPRGKVVVGPLKGVYGCDEPGSNVNRTARGHNLLASTRPRQVTLLSLVRDAVACLPGGEGTRAHITALVRRSQYLVPDSAEQSLQAAVSGALDRMHGCPDPCVQYLPTRKLWVYLHGNRTEEEFEKLHAETQQQSKIKAMANNQQKKSNSTPKSKSSRSAKSAKPTPPVETGPSCNVHMEEEVDGEDVNVDVEETESHNSLNTSTVSAGTSLLQSKTPRSFTSTLLKRNAVHVGNSRSVVRVLSSTSSSGKSLISPTALQPNPTKESPKSSKSSSKSGTHNSHHSQHKRFLESVGKHKHKTNQSGSHEKKITTSGTAASTSPSVQTKSANQSVQLAGQTVQLPSGQTVQITGQTVQLSGQTVQLGTQTMQLGSQTLQLAGQSVQLVNQGRTGSEQTRSPIHKQSTPLVAKILTNAQLRSSGTGSTTSTTSLRVSGLNLAQLQGKPLFLQTGSSSKSQNILFQTTGNSNSITVPGNGETRQLSQRPSTPTTQHTLLLSNIGGQMVRVAGSGAIIGSTLRLQTPATQANSGVLLGSHTLKLQGSPIRLHQNVVGGATTSRVLLTGGTRLHGLKILPVHHSLPKGSSVSSRQVYARIISPATANASGDSSTNVTIGAQSNPTASTPSTTNNPDSQ